MWRRMLLLALGLGVGLAVFGGTPAAVGESAGADSGIPCAEESPAGRISNERPVLQATAVTGFVLTAGICGAGIRILRRGWGC